MNAIQLNTVNVKRPALIPMPLANTEKKYQTAEDGEAGTPRHELARPIGELPPRRHPQFSFNYRQKKSSVAKQVLKSCKGNYAPPRIRPFSNLSSRYCVSPRA